MIVRNGGSEIISDREREIINLLEKGLTNNEIADRLFLSKNTIKWYVQQLNQKLSTNTREEIVAEASRLGLLTSQGDTQFSWRPHDNLPRQTTPFVGREEEIDALQRIFTREDVRLLTIVAPGGMGKTRIALELAEQQLGRFADGVYFVPLQATNDAAAILAHIADAVGFQSLNPDQTQDQQILHFLSDKAILLLLDNFEQVVNGADLVNQILSSALEVKMLITSREKLNLLSETTYVLKGMQYPDWDSLEDAYTCDAVQLLIRAAQRIRPDWHVTESNIDAVKRLAELTEGMPLAILLATTWLDVYSLHRICDEIQKSVDILSTTLRDVPHRQRSIRAIFNHSWGRLSEVERDVFMQMSVFRDGCTAVAAETIAGANPLHLQGLVTKALVSRTQDARFVLHELLRQYAAEQLMIAGGEDVTRSAHMTYYADSIYAREDHLKDRRQLVAIDEISDDLQNILAAWDCACQIKNYTVIGQMLEPMRLLMLLTNRMNRYAALLDDAIERFEDDDRIQLHISLHVYHADALIEQSLTQQSFDIMKQVEPRLRDHGDPTVQALGLVTLSRASYILGDPEASSNYAEAYMDLAREMDDLWHQTQAHYALSLITGLWNAQQPLEHIEHCLAISRQSGDRYWLSQGYVLGGLMLARLGMSSDAQAYTEKALKIAEELRNTGTIVLALSNLSAYAKSDGNWMRSEQLVQEAIQLAHALGYSSYHADMVLRLCDLRLIQGDLTQAQTILDESESLINRVQYPATHSHYYTAQSTLAEYKGHYNTAYQFAEKATSYIQTNMNWSLVHHAILRLAWTLCCVDAFEDAKTHLIQITKQELQRPNPWGLLNTAALLGIYLAHNEQHQQAAELLSFVAVHPIRSVWLQQHPKVIETQELLRKELNEATYQITLTRGESLDIQAVLADILNNLEYT